MNHQNKKKVSKIIAHIQWKLPFVDLTIKLTILCSPLFFLSLIFLLFHKHFHFLFFNKENKGISSCFSVQCKENISRNLLKCIIWIIAHRNFNS